MRITGGTGLLLAALLATANLAGALTAAEKCEAGKLKVVGKYGFCRLKAEEKAVKTGDPVDYSKCDLKYADKWGPIETQAGGMCPSNGDQGSMQAFVAQHTDDVALLLGGGTLIDCGNALVEAGENCDQGNLDGATCVTEGFAGGTLACGAGCAFDTAGCWNARFVDNANGTISDNLTGLTWEKKTELNFASNPGNPHDADNTYRWSGTCSVATSKFCQPTSAAAALCVPNTENDNSACFPCGVGEGTCSATTTIWTAAADRNSASFAGHSDWRVPTRAELLSIIDYADPIPEPMVDVAFDGASCGAACTDVTSPACSCTADVYWSASASASDPSAATLVYFNYGSVNFPIMTNDYRSRLVRGGS